MATPSSTPPRLLVLYGSETGTAQDVAEFVQQRAFNRQLLDTQVCAMDAFPVAQLLPQCSTVVFVVSTTGDGEAPENMRNAWRGLLRKTLGPQWLAGVRIAVFGLGDSSYAKYNAVARRLQARLLQLGASELIDRGLGDDQHAYGYFGALNPWLEKLWTAVLQLHPLPEGVAIDDSPKPVEPRYSVVVHEAGAKEVETARKLTARTDESKFYAPPRTAVGVEKGIHLAPVVVNKRITAQDWEQDVRHLEFDISEGGDGSSVVDAADAPFRAGDIAVVYPENVAGVDDMLKYVKMDGDAVISINAADGSKQLDLPSPVTVRDVFAKYLAILEIPRRSFFERLSLFAANEEEKEKLEELSSAEGVDLLYDYCIREKKTYAEVLTDFPSVTVPLTILLQLIPRQQPRSYSISSSALLHPGRVHLTVAIVDFLTPYKRRRNGICSSFFTSLDPSKEQKRVPMWIKKGLFESPSLDHDVLLIGPGTGLASMRAMVQERQFLRKHAKGNTSGATYLYFGCRHENKDFLYGDELRGLVTSGDLTELHTAFSRDQDHKIYVQTRLAENKEAVFDFIMNGEGCIYIAGSAKRMPNDVYEVLRDILRSVGKIPLPTAEKVMKTLARKKRYVVESWS
ncbi:NADPH-dependent diflavin oxidoreductase 1 [Phytophthora fragariae]|uniref:NADPH-dependent diflavin oxidoreductase 1 n=1 Tax=Phytophthora fragariae TaxID=53985 RepID=A0A6A3M5V5_9STRA|nr:NADPH-dependent diflavin oxidoreductase 1 [Phytophthora fragariae]KAE8947464.1 NADPH-dependent diflavin oxidoreductase 1 [Phytophthora fragariae]KAE9027319.1 NADPH-dependent diflavin oxidoreductase 1 [Phytophthora fragariae]KAE9134572.1 NADPH-dependent diflavin oxidoreductase 1 [Phytophthora fragariae]KAE9135062.1 NADPH-dependent diflavin oxidoreductase 1 [Phytophthora fragariae]